MGYEWMGYGYMRCVIPWIGDCVYVRSDQDKPFIARVDKMWTDSK